MDGTLLDNKHGHILPYSPLAMNSSVAGSETHIILPSSGLQGLKDMISTKQNHLIHKLLVLLNSVSCPFPHLSPFPDNIRRGMGTRLIPKNIQTIFYIKKCNFELEKKDQM